MILPFVYFPFPAYAYDVQDSLTGDSKTQQETRSGNFIISLTNFVFFSRITN